MSNAKPGPLAKSAPPAETPAVTTEDVAALVAAPVVPAPAKLATTAKRRRVVVSQGVYDDLVRLRKVTDPGSGHELRVGDDGTVTAYDRATNKPADVDVVCPLVPQD